jgi:hypothetical protein
MHAVSSLEPSPRERLFQNLERWAKLLITPKAYSLAAFFGGLLLITYYASIRFLPDLDLSSTLWVLVCIALMGALILVVFGGALAMPGVLWLTTLAPQSDTLAADSVRQQLLARSFLRQFLLPLWIVVIVPFAASILLSRTFKTHGLQVLGLIGPLLLWPTAPAVHLFFERKKTDRSKPKISSEQSSKRPSRFESAFLFWQVAIASWAAWMVSLLFISRGIISRPVANEWQLILFAACSYVWIAFANLTVVLLSKNPTHTAAPVQKLGIESGAGVAVCLLILVLLAPSYLPRLIVRTLGLGAIENATLLLDERAKLTEARRNHCGHGEDPPNGLSGVNLLNVLGSRLLVECVDKDETYRFIAPKDVVLSWSTRQSVN